MKLKPVRTKTKRNSTPKAKPGQVAEYWDRDLRDDGYRGAVVKVKGRKGSVLSFFVVDPKTGTVEGGRTPLQVDLEDGDVVWGDLPSTAQLVGNRDTARYGVLFLAPDWLKQRGVTVREGGKWPRVLAL